VEVDLPVHGCACGLQARDGLVRGQVDKLVHDSPQARLRSSITHV
jgi:hypothetical protein